MARNNQYPIILGVTPPKVNDYYMANLKQKDRVQRIGHPEKITTKRNKYDRQRLSLF